MSQWIRYMSKNKKRSFPDSASKFLKIATEGSTGIAKKDKNTLGVSSSASKSKANTKTSSVTNPQTWKASGVIPEGSPLGGSTIGVINDKIKNALQRLNDNDLMKDNKVVKLVIDNPGYVNRLITLFIKLRELSFSLTSKDFELIEQNVDISGQLADILGSMHEMKIDVKLFSLTQFVKAAESSMQFKLGLEQLHREHSLSQVSLGLLMQFPACASEIADLKIKLKERGYSMKPIANTLKLFDQDAILKVINTLIFAVDNNVYFPELISLLLNGQKELDSILEGAGKLAGAHLLSENYFKGIVERPENANITAKMIILLAESNLISNFSAPEIQTINRLGKAAYFLMEQLQDHKLLSAANYALLCNDKGSILKSPVIIDAFSRLPLFERINEDELNTILNLIGNNADSPAHRITQIQEILDSHIFMDSPAPAINTRSI
jgi:hypothetical protein